MEDDSMIDLFDGLAEAQARALRMCIEGRSFFLTGSAGTGKSEVVRRMSQYLEERGKSYWITGTTGIAAVNIGGRTIHSVLRMNPDLDALSLAEYENYVQNQLALLQTTLGKRSRIPNPDLKFSYKFVTSLRKLEVLILDEVSMLSVETLEKMNKLLQMIRGRLSLPMGGLKTILVGDFYQLPPVKKSKFLFESPLFWTLMQDTIELNHCFRQSDASFVALLNRFRKGTLLEEDIQSLAARLNQDVSIHGIEPTMLFSRNVDVDRMNRERLCALDGVTMRYQMRRTMTSASKVQSASLKKIKDKEISSESLNSWPKHWSAQMDSFVRDLRVEPIVELKVGAQVMLTYNLDVEGGLCNGSRGVVQGFTDIPETPDPETLFDKHEMDTDVPMVYPKQRMPVVKFCNGRTIEMPYVRWTRALDDPDLQAKTQLVIWQVPLKLSWATTIHKSQGLTMDSVSIQMDRSVFEAGQAYVAVSRVKSLGGLSLTSWDPSVIKAHEKVIFFSTHSYDFLKDYYSKTD